MTDARVRVREVEADLKNRGLLPRSEREELAVRIDQAFPNADVISSERYARLTARDHLTLKLAADSAIEIVAEGDTKAAPPVEREESARRKLAAMAK